MKPKIKPLGFFGRLRRHLFGSRMTWDERSVALARKAELFGYEIMTWEWHVYQDDSGRKVRISTIILKD